MLILLEYNYTIEYKKGKENSIADAFSRKPESTIPTSCNAINMAILKWIEDIEATYQGDDLHKEDLGIGSRFY
jgi:hypothetical protein